MRATNRSLHSTPRRSGGDKRPPRIAYLVDELRSSGVTTYADVAATLNSQGIRPGRSRWNAHDLYLVMRRHRRAHPAAAMSAGPALYARREKDARRAINKLKRRGFKSHDMIARALNASGITTPVRGRPWTARSVSRVLARTKPPRYGRIH